MPDRSPILLWFRRDLRLSDHPALHEAAGSGRPVIPVWLCDEAVEALGAAPRMRIGMGVAELARSLEGLGSRLVLRRGGALGTLRALVAETGSGAVWWTRLHDPLSRRRDGEVEAGLRAGGVEARAFPGHLLFEPERVRTGGGGFFKVYGPFFRAVRALDAGEPLPAPSRIPGPEAWPGSELLEDWRLDAAMNRGGPVVAQWQRPGDVDRRRAGKPARHGARVLRRGAPVLGAVAARPVSPARAGPRGRPGGGIGGVPGAAAGAGPVRRGA